LFFAAVPFLTFPARLSPQDVISDLNKDHAKQASALRCFFAGGFAGAISRTAVMPLTVIKSVSQLQPGHQSWKETARAMYRVGGARMFWLGNAPGLIRIFPHSGLKFSGYDVLASRWAQASHPHVYRNRFMCGTAAGALASVLLYPLDILKSTVTQYKFSHLAAKQPVPPLAWLGAARELWVHGGATRGMAASAVGASLHNGFLFMGYYTLRSWWPDGGAPASLACGVMAGMLAQITYPLDLIRRSALHNKMHAYDTARVLIDQGGVLGLYRGSVANLVKVAPLFGLQFMMYELFLASDFADGLVK
jgi:hypothetical protein